MNQITKEEFQNLCLLLDIIWPSLVDKYLKKYHIVKTSIPDHIIRKNILYKLNIQKELKDFGFEYPIQYIKLALNTRKRYKRIKIKK